MIRTLLERLRQGHRTVAYPAAPPSLPDRFRGLPSIRPGCPEGCAACVAACPVGAASRTAAGARIDLGRCLFCGECAAACPRAAIEFTREYRMAARRREDLAAEDARAWKVAEALDAKARSLFGRSLKLRQVSAGGCNACEADVNVLSTVVFDLGRFGIQFVASPRHADGLLVTGPVPENMALALKKTYDAVPEPRIVVAVGACAIAGGPYAGHAEVRGGVDAVVPVDLYVPGCPPHPATILDGLLRLLGRIGESAAG